jgi:hypothetical protein
MLEPNELRVVLGISCRYIRAQINPGKFERSSSWEISLAGISKAHADGRKGVSATIRVAGELALFVLPPTTSLICELLLASSRLRYCVRYCIARNLLEQSLLTHSCKAAKKRELIGKQMTNRASGARDSQAVRRLAASRVERSSTKAFNFIHTACCLTPQRRSLWGNERKSGD